MLIQIKRYYKENSRPKWLHWVKVNSIKYFRKKIQATGLAKNISKSRKDIILKSFVTPTLMVKFFYLKISCIFFLLS